MLKISCEHHCFRIQIYFIIDFKSILNHVKSDKKRLFLLKVGWRWTKPLPSILPVTSRLILELPDYSLEFM
jgi:hypothetical protein